MKLNLLSVIVAIIGFTFQANANFYIGPKIGGSFNVGEYKSYDVNNTSDIHSAKGGAGASFYGGLNLGYDFSTNSPIYFAIDGSVLGHSLNNEVRRSSTTSGATQPLAKLKNNIYYITSFQIGYKLYNDVIPFISLGVSGGKYKLSLVNDGPGNRGLDTASSQTIRKSVYGFTPGLGVKFPLKNKWFVRINYDYLLGSKLSHSFTNTTGSTGTWNYSQRVRQHSIGIALDYQF